MFWAIFDQFWSFLPDGDFSKKFGSVTDKCIWSPTTPNPEKTYVQTEGRTEGRTHGQSLFCRTLPAEVGGPIIGRKVTHNFALRNLIFKLQ